MSNILIQHYLAELDRVTKYSGSNTERVISEAFKDLLKAWARQNGLIFLAEYSFTSSQKNTIRPDGAIVHDLRVPLGYWEAKDTSDDLDEEIAKKFKKGYPQDNIIFENSHVAILFQNRQEVTRCQMDDVAQLGKLLTLFFGYERKEIAEFRRAVEQFRTDLPAVLEALRDKIDAAYATNAAFKKAADAFLAQSRQTINPAISEADVREMLIQHILTEEIFAHVFNEGDFHRDNNIAKSLYALEAKFFTGSVKKATLAALETYYAAIRTNAAQISSHSEKQTFLKVIYENFYKVYNPKAADRLGVVYTPNEIVKFMIEGADWLCEKHFGKNLIDRDVEILDPATGTGTFICELLDYFRGQKQKLAHKYKEELHANEVAILPYYVANLNIEATYAAITGQYAEYPNLCFVDTLDNVAGLGIRSGHQHDLFGAMSEENVERIKRQNRRKISVVIGNPPYNANQQNENDNNKNRTYQRVDERIKATYIKQSTAQKTKVYDMYARFFRWASDRLHDDGVLAFITNRSFIESRTFDGFRKTVTAEFNEIYVVDLGGDVRANPKLSGTKHNVFGIQTGVAISFFVKRKGVTGCKIFYVRRPEMETADDKLAWLGSNKVATLEFEPIKPDAKQNWLNLTENDWDSLVPIADKKTKAAKVKTQERSLFKLFSLGVVTNRDEWVYGENISVLEEKSKFLIQKYNELTRKSKAAETTEMDFPVKWTRHLKNLSSGKHLIRYDANCISDCLYRPFTKRKLYFSYELNEFRYQIPHFFPSNKISNTAICFTVGGRLDFFSFGVNAIPSLTVLSLDANQVLARYRYSSSGEKIDNITDWGLKQFTTHYAKNSKRKITKDDIFHYVYGVLHDPIYREKYAQNLKREFPRIPFYPDFWAWAKWGERLMDLHIGYESEEPWDVARLDVRDERARAAGQAPKPILKSAPEDGIIRIDSETTLTNIPREAFQYRLGNRSALDWILDQYKEKTPKDPTIREKFNTYRFADYKEKVIDLIARVTRVSVETMAITEAMKKA